MARKTTFSASRLNNRIYPLTYSVKTKYGIDALYFTVASVEDIYKLIRDRAGASCMFLTSAITWKRTGYSSLLRK